MAHLSVQAFQGPTRLRIDFIEKNCLTIPAVWFVQAEVSSCYHLRRYLTAVGQSCRCYAPQLGRDGPKQQFPQRLSGGAAAHVSVTAALGTCGTHAERHTCSVVGNSLGDWFFPTKAISRGTSGGGPECPRARSVGTEGNPSPRRNPLRKSNLVT
jgi:hypothetical protein